MTEYRKMYEKCILCPRRCGVNRLAGERGVCGVSAEIMVSRAALHMWEEPCISGNEGSGTVFFSGCNLHCVFCQNYEISGTEPLGKIVAVERLAEIFFELQNKGANNINLVTATHYIPSVAEALRISKNKGLRIPVVYNCGGYETVESLKLLEGLVDIWLPDFKYFRNETAMVMSKAKGYPDLAKAAIEEMFSQAGEAVFDEDSGLIKKGVIVRHLVLPGHIKETCEVLEYLYNRYGDSIYVSIMNQYTPFEERLKTVAAPSELLRKVTKREYERVIDFALDLGIKNGFTQEGKAASESFIPSFSDYEGI